VTSAAPPPLRKNRDFILLWSGQVVSTVGSEVSQLAYPLLVLALTHSPRDAGIVGFARALELCLAEMPGEQARQASLRNRLYEGITSNLPDITLNGPALDRPDLRLAGNLNLSLGYVEGQALLLDMQDRLAVSSGSACTSANPQPSHVLRALGLSDDAVRSSLRFGLGRFNTADEVESAIETVCDSVNRLRKMSSMA